MHYVLLLSILAWICEAYPDGAPDRVCSNGLVPGHGKKEHGVSPYRVSASSSRYSPNKPIRVRIESLTDDTFKGFVIQAQDSYGDAIIEGEWRSEDGKSIRKCGAVTHRDPGEKLDVLLTWTPKHGSGSVTFVATIAKTKKIYYHNIKADVVGGSHKPVAKPESQLFEPVQDDEAFESRLKVSKLRPAVTKHQWSSSGPSVFTSWSMQPHRPPVRQSKSIIGRPAPSSTTVDFFARPSSQSFLHRPFPSHDKSRSFPPNAGLEVERMQFGPPLRFPSRFGH